MKTTRNNGFTLVELMSVLLIVSLLALMSYRGLGAILAGSDHLRRETARWRQIEAFMMRFEDDLRMASTRPVRSVTGMSPAWLGLPAGMPETRLEFSRFSTAEGMDQPRRLTYRLNARHEIELWLWPSLDHVPDTVPKRFTVLPDINVFELHYLDANLAWTAAWPNTAADAAIPRAVRFRIVTSSGEEIVRMIDLST